MKHLRLPIDERVEHVLRELERHPHRVAIVVVAHVVTPVHEVGIRLAGVLHVPVEHVDHAVAAVDFDDGRDERDEMVADILDVRAFVDRQPIRELHEGRRRTGFGAVNRPRDVVDRRRVGGDAYRLVVVHADDARIGELGELGLVRVQPRHQLFARDGDRHHLPTFLRLAD